MKIIACIGLLLFNLYYLALFTVNTLLKVPKLLWKMLPETGLYKYRLNPLRSVHQDVFS